MTWPKAIVVGILGGVVAGAIIAAVDAYTQQSGPSAPCNCDEPKPVVEAESHRAEEDAGVGG